jgi:hypothetical protein
MEVEAIRAIVNTGLSPAGDELGPSGTPAAVDAQRRPGGMALRAGSFLESWLLLGRWCDAA